MAGNLKDSNSLESTEQENFPQSLGKPVPLEIIENPLKKPKSLMAQAGQKRGTYQRQ